MGKETPVDQTTNTSCHIQILGLGSDNGGVVPSALLFFDRQRYLFNVGEGFQRFCVEHKIKLARVSAVLTTRNTTEATGGLPGMLLTMADTSCGGLLSGHAGLCLHGPPGLHTLVNAFRTFINTKDMGVRVHEFGGSSKNTTNILTTAEIGAELDPIIKNVDVKISPVLLQSSTISAKEECTANGGEPEAKRQRTDDYEDIITTAAETPAACYIVRLPDIPGKFLPQKAAALGVPRGPLYGKLVRGESVMSASGKMVTPEEVLEASTPGPTVIIIDCPSLSYVPSLLSSVALKTVLVEDGEERKKVACVLHLSPKEVVADARYKNWIEQCAGPTHIVAAEAVGKDAPVLRKSTILQAKLNVIHSSIFPLVGKVPILPKHDNGVVEDSVVSGDNMLKFHFRPLTKKGLDREEVPEPLDLSQVQDDLKTQKPSVANAIKQVISHQQLPAPIRAVTDSPDYEDARVTFLGTGAAVPSKYRNVTGIFLDLGAKNGTLMMDCGEGSYNQLRRMFGVDEAHRLVGALKCIWVSHIHADHHVGLPMMLAARSRILGPDVEPLVVIGPRPLRRALLNYSRLEPMSVCFIEAMHTAMPPVSPPDSPPPPPRMAEALERVKKSLGLSQLKSIRVAHCAHAFGLLLESETQPRWKIVFSGDTRPCDSVIEAAKNATLLIHEATFEDDLQEEAEAKRHCTTKEAVNVGNAADAYCTLLTHFSQRYPKIPVIGESVYGRVGIAFDLMTVGLQDLSILPSIVPVVKQLFEEGEEEEEEEKEGERVPEMFS